MNELFVGCSKIGKMNNLKNPDESDVVFLHGQFLLCIFSAKNLPDMDSWIAKLYDKNDVTDPFVDVWLGNARYGNINCGISCLRIQNELNFWMKNSRFTEKCNIFLNIMIVRLEQQILWEV